MKVLTLMRFSATRILNVLRFSSQEAPRPIYPTWHPFSRSFIVPSIRHLSKFPKHSVIKLPNLSPTMETGTVISWAKKEGDQISEGDLLAEIETDKATMSLDASEEGFLAKILVNPGTKDVPVGIPLCIIVQDQSLVGNFKDFTSSDAGKPKPTEPKAPTPEPTIAAPAITTPPIVSSSHKKHCGERIFASPLAKRLARERGIDLSSIKNGSGLLGMITSLDLAKGGPVSVAGRSKMTESLDIPLSGMRTVIAKRLLLSKQSVPHYYLTVDVNLDSVTKIREEMNQKLAKCKRAEKLSVNDFLIKAISYACLKVPECNSAWMGDFIRQYSGVDVSVAVATPNGLITPIVKGAHLKNLTDISSTVKELTKRARDNKLQPHEFQGGTITISNLGMFGISNFSAIINPPQACILAVGSTRETVLPKITESRKELVVSNVMSVTLCCDHRVVDGAVGAKWLAEFKVAIEEPGMMLL